MKKLMLFLKLTQSVSILIVTIIVYFCGNIFGFNNMIVAQLDGLRLSLYTTLAQIMGALLGIVIAGLAILLTMDKSTAMQLLKKSKYYEELFSIFISGITRLAIGTMICVIALIFDKDTEPHVWLSYIVLWSFLLASISLSRCIWVLKNVIKLQLK